MIKKMEALGFEKLRLLAVWVGALSWRWSVLIGKYWGSRLIKQNGLYFTRSFYVHFMHAYFMCGSVRSNCVAEVVGCVSLAFILQIFQKKVFFIFCIYKRRFKWIRNSNLNRCYIIQFLIRILWYTLRRFSAEKFETRYFKTFLMFLTLPHKTFAEYSIYLQWRYE